MKLSQLLTAYCCDTAQTEVTEANAMVYLKINDIVNTDVQWISNSLMKRERREKQIKILLIDFHTTGMERVVNQLEKGEPIPPFEELYQRAKEQIEELL